MSDSETTPNDSKNKSIHLVSIPEDCVLYDRDPNQLHAAILKHRKIEPLQQKKACLVLVTLVIIDVVIVSAVIGIFLAKQSPTVERHDPDPNDLLPVFPDWDDIDEPPSDSRESDGLRVMQECDGDGKEGSSSERVDGLSTSANELIQKSASKQSLERGCTPHTEVHTAFANSNENMEDDAKTAVGEDSDPESDDSRKRRLSF